MGVSGFIQCECLCLRLNITKLAATDVDHDISVNPCPVYLFTKETNCRETGLAIQVGHVLLRLLWKANWKAMRPVGPTKP